MATLLSSLLLSFARRYAVVDASAVRIGIDGGRLEVRDVALDVAAVAALLPLPFTIVAARAAYLRLHVPWQAITSAAAVAVRLFSWGAARGYARRVTRRCTGAAEASQVWTLPARTPPAGPRTWGRRRRRWWS